MERYGKADAMNHGSDRVLGIDVQHRPIYLRGFRRGDGVWQSPPGFACFTFPPTVQIVGNVMLTFGCYRTEPRPVA